MMRISMALFCAFICAPAGAETFYYVSKTYTISNYDVKETPIMTTGILEIDGSKLKGGLKGKTISNEENFKAFVSATFTNGAATYNVSRSTQLFNFSFNKRGKISSTTVCQYCAPGEDEGWHIFDKASASPFGRPIDTNIQYTAKGAERHVGGFGQWFKKVPAWASRIARNAAYSASNPPSRFFGGQCRRRSS